MIPTIAIVGVEEVKPSDRGEELETCSRDILGEEFSYRGQRGSKSSRGKEVGLGI